MAIQYTATAITITDDTGARPPIVLPPTATATEVDAAAAEYHSQDPDPDWDTFVAWLYQFPPISTGMDAARRSTDPQGEPATTGLATTLDEARLRKSYQPFALAWGLFLLASGMAPEALGAIVAKAVECNLPAEFITALQPGTTP
jgi:hypothetical protein